MVERSNGDQTAGATDAAETAATPLPQPRDRSVGWKIAAVLAVIAIAGATIFQNLPPRPWWPDGLFDPTASSPQMARPAAALDVEDPADVRTLLTVIKRDDGSTTVELGRAFGPQRIEHARSTSQHLLVREFHRQAFLIAARDERGASTRDELLDDIPPTPGGSTIEIRAVHHIGGAQRILVRSLTNGQVDATSPPLLIQDTDPGEIGEEFGHVMLLEKLSRTAMPKILDGLGVQGRPNVWRADAAVPEGVEEKLATLDIVDHVLALRSLHAAVRADGESPARLGALVRGYAQLGSLTAHHWGAANRAFEARSLLYAQRLLEKDSHSPWAVRHRAFANALANYHALALIDLKSIADAAPAQAPPPAWVDLLDAYLKCDVERLDAAQPPLHRLAALLKMDALEYPMYSRPLVRAAEETIRLAPDCARAFDVISLHGGLGDVHKSTVLGPQSFQIFFRNKLDAAPDLPQVVRDALEDDADDPDLDLALRAADRATLQPGEPSWSVLAHLALEERFAQVDRRMNFMAKRWSVPVDDYWSEARTLIEGHRFRPYLGSLTGRPAEIRDYVDFLKTYDRSDLQFRARDFLLSRTQKNAPDREAGLSDWSLATGHNPSSARDLGVIINNTPEASRSKYAAKLLEISPYSPFARATLIEHDWPNAEPNLETWLQESGDSPMILRALAAKFIEQERFEDARRLLAKCVVQAPDGWIFEQLAECHWKAGDEGGWVETLDAYLENTEPAGLEHAQTQVKLADYFALKGDPARAKPYADAAANTWAAWAMLCAARVDELLGDLDSAELWLQRVTDRYPNMWASWYLFCRRTGVGDLESARAVTKAGLRNPDTAATESAAYFRWIEGDVDEAIRTLEALMATEPTGPVAVSLAFLYDQTGAHDQRDELMTRIVEGGVNQIGPKTNALCRLLQKAMTTPDQITDATAFDAALDAFKPDSAAYQHMLVGRFFLNRGRPDDARAHLEECRRDLALDGWNRALATTWLFQAFPDETRPVPPAPKNEDVESTPAGDPV